MGSLGGGVVQLRRGLVKVSAKSRRAEELSRALETNQQNPPNKKVRLRSHVRLEIGDEEWVVALASSRLSRPRLIT